VGRWTDETVRAKCWHSAFLRSLIELCTAIEAGRQYEVLAAAKAVAVRVVLIIEALPWRSKSSIRPSSTYAYPCANPQYYV
jgi:hypothetical protein